jgi:hypothetical protein
MQQKFRISIQDTVVGIATASGVRKAEESCLDSHQWKEVFLLCNVSCPALGLTKSPVRYVARFISGY